MAFLYIIMMIERMRLIIPVLYVYKSSKAPFTIRD